jgi:hypothetical protein
VLRARVRFPSLSRARGPISVAPSRAKTTVDIAKRFQPSGGGGIVIGQSEAGFVAAINRVAAEPGGGRELLFQDLGWGDAEAAELRLALQYAAAKCAFPKGGVEVWVTRGNRISEEAMATLPPRSWGDFTGERAVWEGKFHTK